MKPNIGIKPESLQEIARLLNVLLADETMLYLKTRNAHWNVEGPDFHTAHLFFETQYTQLAEIIDEVAERIRYMGHYAVASMNGYLKLTHLTEESREKNDSKGFMEELLRAHEAIAIHIRESIDTYTKLNDQGTADFVTGLLEQHEKMSWMLRAHLR